MSSQTKCIFCQIVARTIPAKIEVENEDFICIRDLHPQAKEHLLVIPKAHVASLADAGGTELVGPLLAFGVEVAHRLKLLPHGFRSVINTGAGGGQTVFHLHLHLLGGETLSGKFA